jgi:MFS family permease
VRDVLRRRGMRLLLAGQTTSMFGDWVLLLVLGIWVRALGGSNSQAGAVLLAVAAPSLISPLFGWVVDRFRRRTFLIAVNLLSAAMLTPLLLVRDHGDIGIIFVVAVLYGVSQTVGDGAFSGLVKKLVPDEQLGSANGLFATARQLLRLCGPLVGAGLFAAYGGRTVALVDIASFLIAAGALALLPLAEDRPALRHDAHWRDEVTAGLRHIRQVPDLYRTTTAFAISLLAMGSVDTALFAYIDDGLHRPPTILGVLVTVQGIGVLIGALVAGRLITRLGEIAVCAIGLLTFAIAITIAIAPSLPLAFVAMPFSGLGNTLIGVAFTTLLQRRTPDPLIGRVCAAADMAIGGAATASMALGAALINVVDYRFIFATAAMVLLTTGTKLWHDRRNRHTSMARRAGSRLLSGEPPETVAILAGAERRNDPGAGRPAAPPAWRDPTADRARL